MPTKKRPGRASPAINESTGRSITGEKVKELGIKPDVEAAKRFEAFAVERGKARRARGEQTKSDEFMEVAEICEEGEELARNEAAWLAYIKRPAWNKVHAAPKPAGRADAVRYMLRLYTGTENTKESSEIWRAVEPFCREPCYASVVGVATFLFCAGSFKEAAAMNTAERRRLGGQEALESARTKPALASDPSSEESRREVQVELLLTGEQFARISSFRRDDVIEIAATLLSKGKQFRLKARRFVKRKPGADRKRPGAQRRHD